MSKSCQAPSQYDIRTARLRAVVLCRYMSKLIMSSTLVETDQVPTMGVDKYFRVYYNPDVLKKWSLDESAWVIIHESLHVFLRHHKRFAAHVGERPEGLEWRTALWNLAGDYTINATITQAGGRLPDGCVFHTDYDLPPSLCVEEYYNKLLEKVESGEIKLQKIECYMPGGEGDHGSGAGGQQREWESGAPPSSGAKDGEKDEGDQKTPSPHGMDEHSMDRLRRTVAGDIAEASRQAGRVPAGLAREACDIIKPRLDPRKEIMAQVKYAMNCTKGFGNTTWCRPNRRDTPGGMRIPANVRPMPHPLVVIDTSGSMDKHDLGLALGVVADVMRCVKSDGLNVVSGDTHAATARKVFSTSSVELLGGGGTDMGEAMTQALAKFPMTDVCIVVTDGYTPWPSSQPQVHCQKFLALITNPGGRRHTPGWMREVYVNPDGGRDE